MSRRTRDILIGLLLLAWGLGALGVPLFTSVSRAVAAVVSLVAALVGLGLMVLGLGMAYRTWRRRWGRGRYGLLAGMGLAGLGLAIVLNQITDADLSPWGGLLAGVGLGYVLRVLRD
ncbi:MAG: hypothetical protein GXO54_05630 [Chloroflexi bacterium]|nr:hypothetical protein [Chloroflexota bacterium]